MLCLGQSVFRVSNFVDSSSLKSPQVKSPQKHSKSPRGQQRDEITSNEITSWTPSGHKSPQMTQRQFFMYKHLTPR